MLVGQSIGPFEIEKELGSGAMGTVYRATYTKTGRPVAIKVIAAGLGDNERVQQRFEREADILKQLKHPNIVRLLASGKYHRSPFYAMEFIDGEPLDAILARRGRLSWQEVVELGKQICAALQHAHEAGIIHRDLKPSNLMLEKSGTLKLTDFGIAKDTDVTGLTSANSTVGTAAYMSPEQCRGERNLTPKSDLYSLGVLLYELLTGRKPFVAESAMDMFIQHVQGEFDRPTEHVMDIPIWLDNLVCQLMEKKPENRPLDARTVAQALEDVKVKVEALRSAGEDAVARLARSPGRIAKEERERAESVATVKRRKKKKVVEEVDPGNRTKIVLAILLSVLLLTLVGLLVFALQPAGPAELLQRADKLIKQGDKLFRGNDSSCRELWIDAEEKFLNKLLQKYPNAPEAELAQARLAYIKAGRLYLRGRGDLRQEVTDFDRLARGYEALFALIPQTRPDAPEMEFINRARNELVQWEAPRLLAEGKKRANPDDPTEWPLAREFLNKLVLRYEALGHDAAREAKDILSWMNALETALNKLRRGGSAENEGEKLVMAALRLEQDAKPLPEVRLAWKQIRDWGYQNQVTGAPRFVDTPKYRPYVLAAEAKLQALARRQATAPG
jgi:predicted Ser/Thr protein kinase